MDDVPEFDGEIVERFLKNKAYQDSLNRTHLYDADPNCEHHVVVQWSGVKCSKCRGWYCA